MTAPPSGKVEREVKLGAAPDFTLPDLTGVAPGVDVVAEPALDLDATYVDTPDLQLVRNGVSLRRRTGEGAPRWTLKLPSGDDGSTLARREIDVEDSGHEVPAGLAALVTGWVRSAPLVPAVVIRSHRERLRLVDADGRDLAEVDDDAVTVVQDGAETARFREVEVEMAEHGSADLLRAVSDALVGAGAGEPDPTSKVVRGLGPRATEPVDLSPPPTDAGSTIGDVVTAALRSSVGRIVASDHVIRLDELDPDHDGVRRSRSAVRRLRSDLETFVPVLAPEWVDLVRASAKPLSEALGVVRGTDVLVERLLRSIGALGAHQRSAATEVVRHLEQERRAQLRSLLDVMTSDAYVPLLERLVDAAMAPQFGEDGAAPAAERLPELVHRRWRRLERVVEHLGPEPDDDSLLRVRSLARRTRHAAELAEPVVGSPAALLARDLAELQDVLAGIHHAGSAEQWLRQVLPALGPDERDAAEGLIALQHADIESARARWRDAWSACDTKASTGWLA